MALDTEQMNRKIPPLRLYMVKGMVKESFSTANDGAAAATMDVEVWSRLPEDLLLWEVLRFVPAPTYLRLQSVSRRWRQVLTSADFRNKRLIAAAASRDSDPQRVVAYVIPAYKYVDVNAGDEEMRRMRIVRVVDIDLSSFVPGSFWKSDSYSVVAAADRLVCICNDRDAHARNVWDPETTRYCVLNLLTRTCKVLPAVPFRPQEFVAWGWRAHTPSALTIVGGEAYDMWRNMCFWKGPGKVSVANYDLQAASGDVDSEKWDSWDFVAGSDRPVVALCAGETYLHYQRRVHVLSLVPQDEEGSKLVEVAALADPSSPPLGGLDASQDSASHLRYSPSSKSDVVAMVAHQGVVFFLELLLHKRHDREHEAKKDVVMGVWRLARERLEWEVVAWLDVAELQRLTGVECVETEPFLTGACGVREFLFCNMWVQRMWFSLGLNLSTREWALELFHDPKDHQSPPINFTTPVELCPDLFL